MRLTAGNNGLAVQVQRSATWMCALVIATLLLVFGLDRSTGAAPFQHLYYLPIILAGHRFKMRGGVIVALAAILLYHVANPHLLTFGHEESDLVQMPCFSRWA